jgi:replicative DNA helicase
MAADNALRLISRAIRDRDIAPIIERGVDDSWFANGEYKAVWTFVIQHWSKYAEVPTAVTVKNNFPTFRILHVDDTVEYLLDQMVAHRRRQATIRLIQDATASVENNDHETAITLLGAGIAIIGDEGLNVSHEYDLTSTPMVRYQDYLDFKSRPSGLLGMPTGFPTIDEATAGLQGGQLTTIIAPPKTGKSVLAMQIASTMHDSGVTPLFQSFEMSNSEQKTRHDAFRAKISHARLIRGELETDEETRFKAMLKGLAGQQPFILTDSVSGSTLTQLTGKIQALKPDVVFIDGVYLMIDEITGEQNTPQSLTNTTRGLKRLAQRIDKPIVITTQVLTWKMKGKKVSADSIGYSSSFYQDSDVILGLERSEDDDDDRRILRIVASRNCGPAEADLDWDWAAGRFEEFVAP